MDSPLALFLLPVASLHSYPSLWLTACLCFNTFPSTPAPIASRVARPTVIAWLKFEGSAASRRGHNRGTKGDGITAPAGSVPTDLS